MIKHFSFLLIVFLLSFPFAAVHAAQTPPQIFTYQGRLTNKSSGNLITGAYHFKFSIWNNPTVGNPGKVWPTSDPTSVPVTVTQGVFTVNIGDTANSYPDALNLDFSANQSLYLQVEVSSDNNAWETLSPRQQITSVAFAQIAGAVVGTTTPSTFGTTTPATNSFVTIAATSIASIPLIIAGFVNQVANLFRVQDAAGVGLFTIDNKGNAWVGCPDGNCGVTAPATGGNLIVEKAVIFGNKFRLEQNGASSTIMYDTTNTAIFEFDESSI